MNTSRKVKLQLAKSPAEKEEIKLDVEFEKVDALQLIAKAFERLSAVNVKGDTGADGPRGEKGRDGKDANVKEAIQEVLARIRMPKDGKDGVQGIQGFQGPKGSDGKSIIGPKGDTGNDGKDAKLPSLKELAINTINVIEMLKGDERIDASAIKNLEKHIAKIFNEYIGTGWGTGGPGEVFHDTSLSGKGIPGDPLKVVPSSTTTPVSNEIVAGSGQTFTLADIPISNSQHIYGGGIRLTPGIGNDYTIAGTVITLANSYSSGTILADYLK